MPAVVKLALTSLLAWLALASLPAMAAADDVTIYRCTDAKGHLALRDTPCNKGEQQETRDMVRPKDGVAPVIAPSPPAAPKPAPATTTRIVVVSPPQPLYECIAPDGDRYTSDTGDGNPRWVPLWTLGYPGYRPGFRRGGGTSSSIDINSGNVRIHGSSTNRDPNAFSAYRYGGAGAGTWIRDSCHALPPQEVCARLVDRRDEIRRRFFNAQPTERDTLRVEERGINARLDNDCGGR